MKTIQTAKSAAGVTDEKLCSFEEAGADKMCSSEQSDTCGEGCSFVPTKTG